MSEQSSSELANQSVTPETATPASCFRGGVRSAVPKTVPPLVSVIVVVFRDRQELECLIDNIAPFRGPDLELIVVDGGSADGSLDLLQRESSRIDFWLSERDRGIYDAMNKGILAAQGTYLLHINAGDRLLSVPFTDLKDHAQRNTDVICCRVIEDGTHLFLPRNDWMLRLDNTWHHQGTFYRRSTHIGYDTTYRVFGDFDHNQRLRRAKATVGFLNRVVSSHETDGASSSQNARHEVYRSIQTNFGKLHLLPAWARFQLLKVRATVRAAIGWREAQ